MEPPTSTFSSMPFSEKKAFCNQICKFGLSNQRDYSLPQYMLHWATEKHINNQKIHFEKEQRPPCLNSAKTERSLALTDSQKHLYCWVKKTKNIYLEAGYEIY